LVQGRGVVEHGEDVDDDESEAGQGDGVGSHAEREELDDLAPPVWLEDIAGDETSIDACCDGENGGGVSARLLHDVV
jgi:hypothetical protein